MKINKISSIDSKKGDYLILTHYSGEGISVTSQHKNIEEAIQNLGGYGDRQAIVKLVDINVEES